MKPQRARLPPERDADVVVTRWLRRRWAIIGLGIIAVLTPLGLLAPGRAFGEDAPNRFHALFSGYDFTGAKTTGNGIIGYYSSTLISGIA